MKRGRTSHLPFAGGFRLKTRKQQLNAIGGDVGDNEWFTDFEDFGPIPRQ